MGSNNVKSAMDNQKNSRIHDNDGEEANFTTSSANPNQHRRMALSAKGTRVTSDQVTGYNAGFKDGIESK